MADCTNLKTAICVLIHEINEEHRLFPRVKKLQQHYRQQFAREPDFFVSVPGRVNIIGEHVDYSGYPVLPMAIDQCIILAVGIDENSNLISLTNLENHKYPNFECKLSDIKINLPQTGGPIWFNYYLCGVKGIFEILSGDQRHYGMTVALSGDIPPGSGVSSSSALVSSAVLATAKIHGVCLDRKRLAGISAQCERYIGTQGGGMDQAIAYLAKEGCAQFIEFHPELKATSLHLPQGACFVVANSLTQINKAATSDFNERVVECRLACRLIAFRKKFNNWKMITKLAELQDLLKCDLTDLENIARNLLEKDYYTRTELCEIFSINNDEFENEFLYARTHHMQTFKLRLRALHVIQESLRVQQFRNICADDSVQSKVKILSQLMRQSHESLKTQFECSHTNLDKLVELSDQFGVSARLTGAGWGGCIVALCDSVEISKKYMSTLKEKYYLELPVPILEELQLNDFQNVIFATCPREGADIFTLPSNI
uniref:Galactokinase n=1 Tax=Glossina brevipalpis TaxID=37001 RepID=A0A1A9W4J9_9MUSC